MDIIEILVSVVVFTSLIGIVFQMLGTPDGNITGASLVLYGLIGLFIMIGYVMFLARKMKLKTGR